MFGDKKGNKIGVIFYGSEGYLAQTSYSKCTAYDKEFKVIKEFTVGNVNDAHFGNFIDACISRDYGTLNADAMTGAPVRRRQPPGQYLVLSRRKESRVAR